MSIYNVYCHIPFCKRMCVYCCFAAKYNKSEYTNLELMDTYIEALTKDIKTTEFPENEIFSIVFGGGTPSLLSEQQLKRIVDTLKEKITLERFNEIKFIGYEVSPDTASLDKLKIFRESGFNRISIGVQSFIEDDLKLMGRAYTRDTIHKAIENVRKAKYDILNVDLLIGIPGQSRESIMSNIKDAVSLKVENISVNIFISTYPGGKEFLERCQRKNKKSISAEEMVTIYDDVYQFLCDSGYKKVDNTLFSLPDAMMLPDMDESHDIQKILAFGPGTSGFWQEGVRFTEASIDSYIKEQKVKFEELTLEKHAFAIIWIYLTTYRMVKEEIIYEHFNVGFDGLRERNKGIDFLISVLVNKNLATFDGKTFEINNNSLNEAIVTMQYINGN